VAHFSGNPLFTIRVARAPADAGKTDVSPGLEVAEKSYRSLRVPRREYCRFLYGPTIPPGGHPSVGLLRTAVIEQQRHVDELERAFQVLERARKPITDELSLHVVTAIRNASLHANFGKRG
jgi:hypothetical protein